MDRPPRCGAVRDRLGGRAERAVGHLAAGAGGHARDRGWLPLEVTQPSRAVMLITGPRADPDHAQPGAPQGARLVGGPGGAGRVPRLASGARVRRAPFARRPAADRLPGCVRPALPRAQRPGLAAAGGRDGARAGRGRVGVRVRGAPRPARALRLAAGDAPARARRRAPACSSPRPTSSRSPRSRRASSARCRSRAGRRGSTCWSWSSGR